jgi:hypothetical protein
VAWLEYSLAGELSLPDRLRVRGAALGLRAPWDPAARETVRAAGRALDARAHSHAASRTADALHPGRIAAPAAVGSARGLRVRELEPAALAALLAAHGQSLAAGDGRVLADSARSRITAVEAQGVRAVVKQTPWRGALRAAADRLRGSAGRRGFRAGHGLRARGLGAALPLAYLERRRLGLPLASWLVLEDLRPAPSAVTALESGWDAGEVLDALARFLVALHRRGVDHGDLKGSHVLFGRDPGGGIAPRLIDLEGVRFRARLGESCRLRALVQLNASLPDGYPASARRRAFARYARALPFAGDPRATLARVASQSLARRHRWTGADCEIRPPAPR